MRGVIFVSPNNRDHGIGFFYVPLNCLHLDKQLVGVKAPRLLDDGAGYAAADSGVAGSVVDGEVVGGGGGGIGDGGAMTLPAVALASAAGFLSMLPRAGGKLPE